MPPAPADAPEELLKSYALLSLEREELAAKVAELERELASRSRPGDAQGRSRRSVAAASLAIILMTAITLAVLLGSAAILAGHWDPLGSNAIPPAVQRSASEPKPTPPPNPMTTPSPTAAVLSREQPATPVADRAAFEIVAARGDSWLEARRGSAGGSVVYDGILEQGGSTTFAARRVWLRFAVGDHLDVTVNGKRVADLPPLAGGAVITPERVRVLSVD